LNSLLSLNVRWEKRNEVVYTLINNHSRKQIRRKPVDDTLLVNVNSLPDYFNNIDDNPYLFSDIRGDDYTEISLSKKSWTDIKSLKEDLLNNGYDLKEENRLVDKLIFSDQ